MSNEMRHWLTPNKCPVCGKSFFPASLHGYRDARNHAKLVCTYTCYRESERLHDAELAAKPKKKSGRKPKGAAT